MITYLYKTMSLGNLQRARTGGQVATILLFLMVVVLVFILVTANIGHLAVTTTNLANTADSASLYLASQLSTRSRVMFEALGGLRYCKERGLLAFIGSWIGAIVGAMICGPGCAIIGGTIGGGIGGAIDGSGFEQGLTTGFRIGLSVGGAVAIGAPFGIIGQATLVGIDMAAEIYNYRSRDKDAVKGMREIAKALNGLDVAVQLREGTYLQALSQVVDDPNLEEDSDDLDGDGNRRELISAFQQRWFERTLQLAGVAGDLKTRVRNFVVDGPLKVFRDFAEKCVAAKGHLSRAEFTLPGNDGPIVSLARALLKSYGINVSFWEPEPPPIEPYCLDSRRRSNDPIRWCENEQQRSIHDPIDRVTTEFLSLIAIADEMEGMIENGELNEMAEQWLGWIGVFYYLPHDLDKIRGVDNDPEEDSAVPSGYYFGLDNLVACDASCANTGSVATQGCCEARFVGMQKWKEELIGIRLNGYPEEFDKAFGKAIEAIEDIIGQIETFRGATRRLYDDLKRITGASLSKSIPFGVDPAVYDWTDSRGEHSVSVDVDFAMPYIKKTKSSEKVCLKLVNGSGTATVAITRTDPKNKKVERLGFWNPKWSLSPDEFKVTRTSKSHYSYQPQDDVCRGKMPCLSGIK